MSKKKRNRSSQQGSAAKRPRHDLPDGSPKRGQERKTQPRPSLPPLRRKHAAEIVQHAPLENSSQPAPSDPNVPQTRSPTPPPLNARTALPAEKNQDEERESDTLAHWVASKAKAHPEGYRGNDRPDGMSEGRFDAEILGALFGMREFVQASLPKGKDTQRKAMQGLRALVIPNYYSEGKDTIGECLNAGITAVLRCILFFPDLWCGGSGQIVPEKMDFLTQVLYLVCRLCKTTPDKAPCTTLDLVRDCVETKSVRCCATDFFCALDFVSACRDVHKKQSQQVVRTNLSDLVGIYRQTLLLGNVPSVYLWLPSTPAWSGWEQRMVSRLIDAEKTNHPDHADKVMGCLPHQMIQDNDTNQVVTIAAIRAKVPFKKHDLMTREYTRLEEEEYERRFFKTKPPGELLETRSQFIQCWVRQHGREWMNEEPPKLKEKKPIKNAKTAAIAQAQAASKQLKLFRAK